VVCQLRDPGQFGVDARHATRGLRERDKDVSERTLHLQMRRGR
jgi:hypothetical protein